MRSLIAIALVAIVTSPLLAQSNELALLGGMTSVSTTNSGGSSIDFDNGTAYGLSYNRFWTRSFSTDFSVMKSSHDGNIGFEGEPLLDTGSLDLTTFAGTLQYHVIHTRPLDVYVGAGAAHVSADDLKSADLVAAGVPNVSIDSQTTWLLNAGAAIGIGRSFAVGIDGKYVRYRPDSASPGTDVVRLDLDPLTIALALKFRF